MTKTPAAKDPTRNVWLQLGFPDAEEHFLKAELVLRLHKAINSLGLTQRAAARRIGTTQPELSKILGGKFTEVSLERLMRFLTALGCHIEIKIGAGQENKAGDVTIKDAKNERPSVLDVVALLADLPAQRLARGQVGTVVEQLDDKTLLVEFSDDQGSAYAIAPCPRADLLILHYVPEAA